MKIFLKTITISLISLSSLSGMDTSTVSQGLQLISTYAVRAGACYTGNLAATLIHEGGHVLTGLALGEKPEKIEIGDQQSKYIVSLPGISINPLDVKNSTTTFSSAIFKNSKNDFIITASGPMLTLGLITLLYPLAKDNKTTQNILISCALSNLLALIPESNVNSEDTKSDGTILYEHIESCLPKHSNNIINKVKNNSFASLAHKVFKLGLFGAHYYYQFKSIFHQ